MKVIHKGYKVDIIKITGDINVPAGNTSVSVTLMRNHKEGKGKILLAEIGFRFIIFFFSDYTF